MRSALYSWYRRNARDLPWRATRDPWAILVSEAMLQQTRVETVRAYYGSFLERFPTPSALAAAGEQEVLAAWSGLGYYRRARSLQAAARRMVEQTGGVLPSSPEVLRALPGIGPYTAGAVLSIAFGRRACLVDGNVERVFARVFGLPSRAGSRALRERCWRIAERLLPRSRPGEWNQALMELGATCCTSRAPACERCPWRGECRARRAGRQDELPLRAARPAAIDVELDILCARRGATWLLERRPPAGRMAGMWQFPTRERAPRGSSALLFPTRLAPPAPAAVARRRPLGELRHTITRHRIRARLLEAQAAPASGGRRAAGAERGSPYRWVAATDIEALALTGMARKAWRILRSAGS